MFKSLLPLLSACLLVACTGDLNDPGFDNGPGDLDPNNPPPNPFPDDSFPEDGICGDINVVVDGLTPTVQLLIDQSGSMDQEFGGGERWDAVYNTLMNNDGVVNTLQSTIRFGLSLYTSQDGNAGGQCPILANVPAALDNFGAVNSVFGPARPVEDTPTGESINAVVDILAADSSPGRKVIVLGTDGEPDTCADPDPETPEAREVARQFSLDAAKRAFDAGIRVYVVSVGDQVGQQHLQDMANAGSGLPVGGAQNAEFFVANSPAELVDAFGTIVGGVAGCVFTINGEVDLSRASEGRVALDGTELEYGTEWTMLDGKTFEVLGGACDTIKDANLHQVSAVFPCGSVTGPIID